MHRMPVFYAQRGLTLIELLVVLLIVGIALTSVSPSLSAAIARVQLQAQASRFMSALNLARTEAVMRNTIVSICPSSMANTGLAACNGIYSEGWIVFVNANRDQSVAAAAEPVLRIFDALPAGYRLTNRAGSRHATGMLNYLPDGTVHGNRTLLFCPPANATGESISIVLNIVGRARLERGVYPCAVA